MKRMRMLSALGLIVVFAACDDDRSSVFTPIGDPSYDFTVSAAAANMPAGTATITAGDTVTLSLSGLRDLGAGSSYGFWSVSRDSAGADVVTQGFGSVLEFFMRDSTDAGGAVVTDPITGDVIMVLDTNVVSAARTGSYAGTADPAVFGIEIQVDSTGDGSLTGSANAIVVSIEAGGMSHMMLWNRIGVTGGGAMSFGNFGGGDVISAISPSDYVYPIIGVGRAGVRGDEFSVDFQRIARPPHGFYYVGYLLDENGAGTLVDTLRSGHNAVAELNRVNLFNADMDDLLPQIAGVGIEASQVRNCRSGSAVRNCPTGAAALNLPADAPFGAFRQFVLALEPKAKAAGMGPTVIYSGDIPEIVFAQ